MGKHLIVNFDLLEKNNLSIDEFLFLYKLYKNRNYSDPYIDYNKLSRMSLITIAGKTIVLRKRGKQFIEDNLKNNEKEENIPNFNEIDKFAEQFRLKWKGFKAGAMGSPQAVKDKLTKWINNNPQYSFDDILKAADMYIKSVNNPTYLQRADYFIEKIEKGVATSRLSAFIEEIDNHTEDDWTNEII